MVFNVSIPNQRHTSPDQLKVLTRLSDRVIGRDGLRGRYRPVRIGDTLVISVNAGSSTQARRMVADAVGCDPDNVVATARGW